MGDAEVAETAVTDLIDAAGEGAETAGATSAAQTERVAANTDAAADVESMQRSVGGSGNDVIGAVAGDAKTAASTAEKEGGNIVTRNAMRTAIGTTAVAAAGGIAALGMSLEQNASGCLVSCTNNTNDDFYYQLSRSDKSRYSSVCGGEKDYTKRTSDDCRTFCTAQENNPNDTGICSQNNRAQRGRQQAEKQTAQSGVGRFIGNMFNVAGDGGYSVAPDALSFIMEHIVSFGSSCGVLVVLFLAKDLLIPHLGGGGKLKG